MEDPRDDWLPSGTDPFCRFRCLIARLRAENGCPWDQRQTPTTIKKYLFEETAELAEAIEQGDPDHIREEIGDLFYILLMLCRMFEEQGLFDADSALAGITGKMIRRHPHVFAGQQAGSEEDLRRQWEAIKKKEKKQG